MSSVERFDLVILVFGSTAFAAALPAQDLGKTAVMTEERKLGGTCENRGLLAFEEPHRGGQAAP